MIYLFVLTVERFDGGNPKTMKPETGMSLSTTQQCINQVLLTRTDLSCNPMYGKFQSRAFNSHFASQMSWRLRGMIKFLNIHILLSINKVFSKYY